jgi:hypothetical protein
MGVYGACAADFCFNVLTVGYFLLLKGLLSEISPLYGLFYTDMQNIFTQLFILFKEDSMLFNLLH